MQCWTDNANRFDYHCSSTLVQYGLVIIIFEHIVGLKCFLCVHHNLAHIVATTDTIYELVKVNWPFKHGTITDVGYTFLFWEHCISEVIRIVGFFGRWKKHNCVTSNNQCKHVLHVFIRYKCSKHMHASWS